MIGYTYGDAAYHRQDNELAKDAARFQYLQNLDPVVAQAFFWTYTSRKQRAKAIDQAIKESR